MSKMNLSAYFYPKPGEGEFESFIESLDEAKARSCVRRPQ